MPFALALSGINAANTDLNTTANNIANVDTVGFKSSRAEFSSLYAQTQQGDSLTTSGNGVAVSTIAQQFSQGNINTTSNNLDLALSGNGFFVVSNNGSLAYTRNGAFQVDQNGYLVTASGDQVQGFQPLSTGGFNTGGLSALQLSTAQVAPAATTTADMTLNLPSNATAPTNAFSPTDSTSYNNTTSLTVYDSLGAAHTAQLYFVKGTTTPTASNWSAQLYIDGSAVGAPQNLAYSSAGVLTTPANGSVNFGSYTPTTGASPMNIAFNFGTSTQYGSSFAVNAITQNGYTTGNLTGINISPSGVVQANFTNGQSKTLGEVALANFANPQGLQQTGNTQWVQTFASGAAVNGVAGTSGFGTIQSGALEQSNVNLTAELVNMITASRNFQANSQMINTANQDTQAILRI
jgi:flagellar hook protein FlgE